MKKGSTPRKAAKQGRTTIARSPARRTKKAGPHLRRGAWERIMKIHERIRNGEFPNCVQMAADMEVSHKTMKRDVDFMKERLNLPIEYDEKRWGYYYSKPTDRLPGAPMAEAEMFALLVAHKAIAQYRGTPFEKPLRLAFEKLTGQLDSKERFSLENLQDALSFRPFAPEDTDLQVFQVIATGLRERRALRFNYRNLGAKAAQARHVYPYHLACIDNHWYLFAHDVNRQAIRTFSLTRMSRPDLTKERFVKPADFDPDTYLPGSFTVLTGDKDYDVVIEFDAWATDLIRGRHWHPSQELVELPGGGSRIRMRLSTLDEIDRWVLTWGTHANVIAPTALADRVAKTGLELAKRYSQHP
jgi:predicted DNA-binding transcriptional regulator YafY